MRLQPSGYSTRDRAFPGESRGWAIQSWNAYAKIVTALFVIANPVGVIPTFISLTGGYSTTEKRHTSRVTAATVFIVLVAAAVLGEHLLHFFGISIASFRVGGGILILLMAIGMLGAKPSSERVQKCT